MGKVIMSASSKTDQRIGIMNEIVNGMKVIKMYGWEHAFANKLSKARK